LITPLFGSYIAPQSSAVTTPGNAMGAMSRVRKMNCARLLSRLMTSSAASSGRAHAMVTPKAKMMPRFRNDFHHRSSVSIVR